MRHHLPRAFVLQLIEPSAPARHNGRAADKPLQAIAMIGAAACELSIVFMPGHADMSDFGMGGPAENLATCNHAAADTRSHGHIGQRGLPRSSPRAPFCERSSIDIGIEADRAGQRFGEETGNVAILPARLWRRGDMAPGERSRVKVYRAEAGYAERCESALRSEPVCRFPQGICRIARRNDVARGDIGGRSASREHELGPARFDTAQQSGLLSDLPSPYSSAPLS